ncbi:MAG: hypothetical protein Q7K55_04995 [Candidatus Levybacteria bacterium]|nr:hypothetical protein [Candidatus Levybacteria bacterium]
MKKIFLLVLIIVGLSLLIFRGQKSFPVSQEQIDKGKPFTQIGDKVFKEKEDSQGEVIVTVKPLKLARYNSIPGKGENIVFEVTMETHTVELDKDLKNISVITDNKGNEYKPISWSGGSGGHHINGNLVFPPFSKDAKSIKLVIKEIDNFDRMFEWKVF